MVRIWGKTNYGHFNPLSEKQLTLYCSDQWFIQ